MNATVNPALLSSFIEVADAASFSRAARSLRVTTATVSRNIATLEDAVGSRLFHRTTRRVAPTTAGTALYERTVAHVRALRAALEDFPEHQQEPAGTLKLTAPYDLGATILGGVIARFTTRYPRVHVQAEFSSRVVDLAAEGFDVALRGDTRKQGDRSLTARCLIRRGELAFYAAPTYLARRGTPRAVASEDHAWLVPGPLRRLLDLPKGFTPRVVADDFMFLRGIAQGGGGVAMLPSFVAEPAVVNGDLVRVLPNVRLSAGGLFLFYSPRQPLPSKIAVFRDFLVHAFDKTGLA